MSRLEHLRDRHRGARCVVVANGPSLNQMDLSFLRNEIAIGMNKIHLGFKRFNFHPRYYVAVNEKVLRQSTEEIRRMRCVKFLGSHAVSAGIKEDALTYIVQTDPPPARFSRNLARGMHEGWTVTYAALQVAYHLGFHEVVLIGLDHRYMFDGAPNEERRMAGPDPNHFADDYFGYGQTWDNPDMARSEESFRIAREVFEADGRRIMDATVDGACDVFPKVSHEQLFRTGEQP